MANIQDVNSSIMFGDFTNDQLDSIVMAIKYRRGQLTAQAKQTFGVGSQVSFYSSKRGQRFTGNVEKVGRKFLTVRTQNGLWRVPGNMIQAA